MSASRPEPCVRPAGPSDAVPIARVHVDSWRTAYRGLLPDAFLDGLSVHARTERWRARLRTMSARQRVLVAEQEGEVVGFASTGPTRDDDTDAHVVGELYAVYVLPQLWSRGIGTRLHSAVLAALEEEGFREATLWVLDANARARSFYALTGWSPDGASKRAVYGAPVTEIRYRRALVSPS